MKRRKLRRYSVAVLVFRRIAMCSLSKRAASSVTVIALALGGRVLAASRGGHEGDGAVARLLAGQHSAGPEADPT